MKTLITPLLIVAGLMASKAQNLVTNPSFESYMDCNFSQGDADYALGWFKSSVYNQPPSHADYCNSCSSTYGVPNNPWGTEYAATGNGYIAMTTKVPAWGQFRENIYSQLISPLVVGTTYSLSFKLSLCDNFRLASDKMGLKFSMYPNISISNSAHLFASTPVSQQNGWTVITGTFTADSAYTYIGVGNFFDEANTNEVLVCLSCFQNFNIYYLDDISVVALPRPDPVGLEINKEKPELFYYPNPSEGLITFNTDLPDQTECSIVNLTGQLVRKFHWREVNDNFHQLDLTALEKGYYLIYLYTPSGKLVTPLIKQ